jgi:hypothetical protein
VEPPNQGVLAYGLRRYNVTPGAFRENFNILSNDITPVAQIDVKRIVRTGCAASPPIVPPSS